MNIPQTPQLVRPPFSDKRDNETRRDQGRALVAAAMVWWFARNDWSHPNFADLAEFALNEPGAVHTSQLSHIRNQKMRMLGLKTLDAFGAVNLAVWCYHNDRQLLKALGTSVLTPPVEEMMRDAEVIMNPVTGGPLDQGGWMMVYLGYVELPDIGPLMETDETFKDLAKTTGDYLQKVIMASNRDFYAFSEAAQSICGSKEEASKLVSVAAGVDQYQAIDLQRDLIKISRVLERIDGKRRSVTDLLREMQTRSAAMKSILQKDLPSGLRS